MKLLFRNSYMALLATAGLLALTGAAPATAQSWSGASPFIVGNADHGFADRPSGDFSFTNGASADGSIHGPSLHSHMKLTGENIEELGAMLGLGLFGLSQMNSAHDSGANISRFASILPPAGYSASSGSGRGPSGLTTAPVPEFGTGASFGIMAMLGVAGMSVSRRKRRHAA